MYVYLFFPTKDMTRMTLAESPEKQSTSSKCDTIYNKTKAVTH